jgi:insertion element IS1 protein InsB
MVLEPVLCPTCGNDDAVKHGRSGEGKQRYKCRSLDCTCQTFILDPTYRGRLLIVKHTMVDMAMNGRGILDTARVLHVSPKTVISELKKAVQLEAVNQAELARLEPAQTFVRLCRWEDLEAEADEMWSYA